MNLELNLQNGPLVSILLPTHNRVDVLSFAIRSVLAQTVQDFELLIVGDGCTDNTAEIISSFGDPRIRWFDLPKAPGFGYANRNIGLRTARGEYIAYMAHDDLWLSDHLQLLLASFDDKKIEIVFSRPLLVIPPGMIIPGIFNLNHPPTLEIFLNLRDEIPQDCVVHRRDCFARYGYWNDEIFYGADWDMWKRIIRGGGNGNFAYEGTPTSLHFKANWHDRSQDEGYYTHWRFHYWARLFASGQMPACLKLDVPGDLTEQQSIWRAISSRPAQWNKEIRIAIQQVLDLCALQGNLLADALLALNDEFVNSPLPLDRSFGFDFLPLIDTFKQMPAIRKDLEEARVALADLHGVLSDASISLLGAQRSLEESKIELAHARIALVDTHNALMAIKKTLTWKLHEFIMSIDFVRRVYLMVIMPIRRRRSKIK